MKIPILSSYGYDLEGNLTTVTDPRSEQTIFEYDEMNRLITKTNPLGLTETFAYDANGNLITKTMRNGEIIDFTYDTANQLTIKTLPGNIATTIAYDDVGNATSIVTTNSVLTQTFDAANRLTSVSTNGSLNQPGTTIQYSYNLNGNRLTMTDPSSGITNYAVDALNRITSITNPSSQITNFTYDEIGRQISRVFHNGAVVTLSYESLNRLTDILNATAGGSTISDYAYTYNKVDNRVTQTEQQGNRNFNFDQLDRLVSANITVPPLTDESFSYDSLGNRLTENGTITVSAEDAGTTNNLVYNGENQLESFEILNSDGTSRSLTTHKYDGLGRRIEKDVDGVVTRYIYDFEDIVAEYNGSNNLIAKYTHGHGIDDPLIMHRDINADQVLDDLFYHTDGLGSITELADT